MPNRNKDIKGIRIANNKGTTAALKADPHLAAGLNVAEGKIAYEGVARDLDLPYAKPSWL